MNPHALRRLLPIALCSAWLLALPAQADERQDKATTALTSILFEHDADEFTSYRVRPDGFVEITFASNTPDAVYSTLLEALRKHPDIKGVLAGRGGPACKRFF